MGKLPWCEIESRPTHARKQPGCDPQGGGLCGQTGRRIIFSILPGVNRLVRRLMGNAEPHGKQFQCLGEVPSEAGCACGCVGLWSAGLLAGGGVGEFGRKAPTFAGAAGFTPKSHT
jgi:hypothetical protein